MDTGAFIALADRTDQYHEEAERIYKEIGTKYPQVTTNHVISETYVFLRYNVGFEIAIRVLKALKSAERVGILEIVYSNSDIEDSAIKILEKYSDQALSFVDAVSFAVLERKPEIQDVFAFDSHFFYFTKRNIIGCRPSR